MSDRKKALVVINPVSSHGRAQKISEPAIEELEKSLDLEVYVSKNKGDIEETVFRKSHDFEVLVIAGGDGSVHEAVNGLMKIEDKRPVLAILPVGSGNDSARALGIPFDALKAARVIKKMQVTGIDVGRMNDRYYSN